MKQFIYNLSKNEFLIIFIFLGGILFSQTGASSTNSIKALTIVYDITYPNGIPTDLGNMCYYKSIIYIYQNNITYIYYGKDSEISIIMSNDCGKDMYTLFPNLQLMVKFNRDEDQLKFSGGSMSTSIIKDEDTKNILGYNCTKNEIQIVSHIGNLTFSFSNYLYSYDGYKNYNLEYFSKDIKGLVLRKEMNLGDKDKIQIWTANSVSEQLVDSSLFKLPDYKLMTSEEFQSNLTKNRKFRAQINKECGLKENKFKEIFNIAIDVLAQKNDASSFSENSQNCYSNNSSIKTNESSHNYQTKYNIWAINAESNYSMLQSVLRRINSSNKFNVKNDLLVKQYKKYLLEAQDHMHKIRLEAKNNGVSINISKYEDINY